MTTKTTTKDTIADKLERYHDACEDVRELSTILVKLNDDVRQLRGRVQATETQLNQLASAGVRNSGQIKQLDEDLVVLRRDLARKERRKQAAEERKAKAGETAGALEEQLLASGGTIAQLGRRVATEQAGATTAATG